MLRSASLSGLLSSGQVTVTVDGKPIRNPTYLAICKYKSESDSYMFYCSAEWSVLAAGRYESQSAAVHAAEEEYPGISARWAIHD